MFLLSAFHIQAPNGREEKRLFVEYSEVASLGTAIIGHCGAETYISRFIDRSRNSLRWK